MILVLQTTIAGELSVWGVRRQRIVMQNNKTVAWHGSDRALLLVDEALRSSRLSIRAIRGIIVVRGPGSFTAVRTGLIIANTLGVVLKIPIRGIVARHRLSDDQVLSAARAIGKRRVLVKPWYGKMPNITAPKPQRSQAKAKR